MSNHENFTKGEMPTGENASCHIRGEGHREGCGGGARLSRPGSPYPRGAKVARHQQTATGRVVPSSSSQAVSDRKYNQQFSNQVSSSGEPGARPTGSSERTTSIRWAKNLPVPGRYPSSTSLNGPTSSPETGRATVRNDHSDTPDDINVGIPEHASGQRANFARKNLEKTQKNDEDMTSNVPLQQAPAAEYIPPHKRGIKSKLKIEVDPEVPRQEQADTDSYYAESDTESSSGYVNPHLPLPDHTKQLAPLTPMTLKDLPKRQGVVDKSKKSHPSMDVSVDDEATSSHDCGSSRSSDFFEETVSPFSMGQLSGFFLTWIDTLSSGCVTSFLDKVENHHNHDVDPTNGQLLEKIEQPETIVNIEEEALMKPSMLHRRRDWTSNLVIHREISIRKNLLRRQQEMERECYNRPAQDTQGCETKESSHVPNTSGAPISKEKKLLDSCVLRPAELEDAVGCAEIYNAAVADDEHLTVDTEPVSADRFEVIMGKCRCHDRLPFVVAATQKVDLSDAKNWPSLDAYQQYMRWKQSQPQPQPEENEDEFDEHRICGFAFLQPYERGIGGYNDTESPAVKATVFVRPDHRRGGIGSALLQHLLTQTSILYCGNGIKYKWEDLIHGDDSFRTSDFRNVHRIIVHTMVKSEGNQSHKWIDDVMTSFQFEQCGRLSQVYRANTPQGVEWYDQIIWQHWANRIDSIRTLYASDESECSYDYPGKPHVSG